MYKMYILSVFENEPEKEKMDLDLASWDHKYRR